MLTVALARLRPHSFCRRSGYHRAWAQAVFAWQLVRPYRLKLAWVALCCTFVGFCMAVSPVVIKLVMDRALPQRDLKLAMAILAGFVVLMGLRMAVWYLGQSTFLLVKEQIVFDLRSRVFAHLQELSLSFHSRLGAGFLLDRTLGTASVAAGTFLSLLCYPVITCISTLAFSLGFCLQMDGRLAALAFGLGFLNVAIGVRYARRIERVTREFNLQVNQMAGQVTDVLHGIKTVKAFAREESVTHEFRNRLWPLQLKSREVSLETLMLSYYSEGLGYVIQASVLGYGSWLLLHNEITFGSLVAFLGFQGIIIGMLTSLGTVGGAYGAAVAGLEQMREVLDAAPAVPQVYDTQLPEPLQGHLELRNVTFGYDERTVLQDVSFEARPGESIALVGPSGGGKSTLAGLLLRFHDPRGGQILLDGHDIRNLPLASYRRLFGAVLQDPFVFNETIYNNLAWANPGATPQQIREALEKAQAWEFVSQLPDGWDTVCGESGGNLSGGQRQRLAIARCFLTNPRFVLLDEATSALDNQSEARVQAALREIMRGRTVFIIAHRLSTIRHVDRILVFQTGSIVQQGSYAQLSAAPGTFRDLLQCTQD